MPINYPHGQKRTQLLFLLSRERLCCCDTTRNYTGTVQKSGVAPQQQEIPGMTLHFQRTLDEDCTMYYKYLWNSNRKPKTRAHRGAHFAALILHCFVMVKDSIALCTQLVQSPKKLN